MKAYLESIHLFEGQEKWRAPHDRNELLKPKQCNSWMKRIQTIGLDICGVSIKNIGLIFQEKGGFIWQDSTISSIVGGKDHASCLHFSVRGYYKFRSYLYILNIFNSNNTILKEEGNE